LYGEPRATSGVLFETKDSAIIVSQSIARKAETGEKVDMIKIDARSIDKIHIRKQGSTGKGILYGAIAGVTAGGILDLIYYSSWKNQGGPNHFTNIGEAIAYSINRSPSYFVSMASMIGLACIGTGIGIGAGLGSIKITIPIKGNQEQFDQHKAMLNDCSVKNNPFPGSKHFSKPGDTIVNNNGNR